MKWTNALVVSAIMAGLLFQSALSISTECPSNCQCQNKDIEGTNVVLHCQGFPAKFVPNVFHLTLGHVNTTEMDISLLDNNYGDTLQYLNLSNLGISKISSTDKGFNLPNLKTLTLSNNNLRHLSTDTFEWCHGIVELVVNDNGARDISEDAFIHLQNLMHLNLANNNLLNLDNIDLPQSLVSLDLCNNQLEQIPVLKNKLPNLDMLSLAGNEYNTVSAGVFRGLSKLSTLSLGDAVTSVETGSLSVLSKLTSLKLTGKGDFNAIAGKEIKTLPGLQALDLSFFTFPTITKDMMHGLQSLQSLRLVDINSTSGFQDAVFEPLKNLSLLDLSRSQVLVASLLSGIEKESAISSLESLLVSETNISVLNMQVLSQFPNLKFLDVSYNPLVCDNKWQDLLHASFIGDMKFLNLPETVCNKPKSLFGKQLMDTSVLHEIMKDRATGENDNSTITSSTMSPASNSGIYYYLDLWGITTDDLLYIILALGIGVIILLIVVIIVACCKSKKSRCYCNGAKEGSAESFMMRANSEYTFDNFTLSETMAECQRGTLNRNGKLSTKS